MRQLCLVLALFTTVVATAADNVKLAHAYTTQRPSERQAPVLAGQDKGAGDVFFGIRGGTESRVGVDFGFGFGRSGASTWGFAVGYTGKPNSGTGSSGYYTTSAPGTYERTMETRGYHVGLFGDVGRAHFTVGAEALTETKQVTTVYSDRTSAVAPEVSKTKAGAYAQFGFKFTHSFGVYVHAGSATGVGAGVSFHF